MKKLLLITMLLGVVYADCPNPGDVVLVGQVIGFLCESDEDPPMSCGNVVAPTKDSTAESVTDPAVEVQELSRQPDVEPITPHLSSVSRKRQGRIIAPPRARRLAKNLGIDLITSTSIGANWVIT